MDPPERAVVFASDGKRPIQALDRTQPDFRVEEGPVRDDDVRLQARRDDDPVRRAGRCDRGVIHRCMHHHWHGEFLRFMAEVERRVIRRSIFT